jgi:GNAT superfamily N-acetyltransferase
MPPPLIGPAQRDEYDEVARVWMESWVSTGLEPASNFLLAKLRARVPMEIENGWSLFVADEGKLAAMLGLHFGKRYLDQLLVAPDYQGRNLGRQLLAFTRARLPDKIWLRCARENEGLALVRTRGLCVRERSGRADDRFHDEMLSLACDAVVFAFAQLAVENSAN